MSPILQYDPPFMSNPNQNRILFLGGSGFIGRHFQETLNAFDTFNLDLNAPSFESKASFLQGDIRKSEDLFSAFKKANPTTVIALAAEHKDFGVSKDEYFQTNTRATELILNTLDQFPLVETFVFFSSVAIYGNNLTPSTEMSPPAPINFYGASKLEGEKHVWSWAQKNPNRKVIIIRPAVVYGEHNVANMYRLISQIDRGLFFQVGQGDNVKSICYVKNLVEATLFLSRKLPSGLHIYNYADEPQMKTKDISKTIALALGKSIPKSIPLSLLLILAKPFDWLIKLTGKDLPISSARVKKFNQETFHQAKKVLHEGFKPQFSNVDGIQNMVRWYKNNRKAPTP